MIFPIHKRHKINTIQKETLEQHCKGVLKNAAHRCLMFFAVYLKMNFNSKTAGVQASRSRGYLQMHTSLCSGFVATASL